MQADRGETISAGNFHGEYPAKALDYLAIGQCLTSLERGSNNQNGNLKWHLPMTGRGVMHAIYVF